MMRVGALIRNRRSGFAKASRGFAVLRPTHLNALHHRHNAKMVDYAGWEMPISYPGISQIESHLWTREKASLFDVSHMLQTRITGADRVRFFERLCPADVGGSPEGKAHVSLFTNAKGGIIDDLIVSNAGDHLYVVSNAGCGPKVKAMLSEEVASFSGDVKIETLEDTHALLALQGPEAVKVMEDVCADARGYEDFVFMMGRVQQVPNIGEVRVTRCGYTGEDGFEIMVPREHSIQLADLFVSDGRVKLAGLAARDSLRLEAGLCLYGNEMNESRTPIEAMLTWMIPKNRRVTGAFRGSDVIVDQIVTKPLQRLIGLTSQGGPAMRDGMEVVDPSTNETVGNITSGCPSPSIPGTNVAMAFVNRAACGKGKKFNVVRRRGKPIEAVQIAKLPFVPSKYYTKSSS